MRTLAVFSTLLVVVATVRGDICVVTRDELAFPLQSVVTSSGNIGGESFSVSVVIPLCSDAPSSALVAAATTPLVPSPRYPGWFSLSPSLSFQFSAQIPTDSKQPVVFSSVIQWSTPAAPQLSSIGIVPPPPVGLVLCPNITVAFTEVCYQTNVRNVLLLVAFVLLPIAVSLITIAVAAWRHRSATLTRVVLAASPAAALSPQRSFRRSKSSLSRSGSGRFGKDDGILPDEASGMREHATVAIIDGLPMNVRLVRSKKHHVPDDGAYVVIQVLEVIGDNEDNDLYLWNRDSSTGKPGATARIHPPSDAVMMFRHAIDDALAAGTWQLCAASSSLSLSALAALAAAHRPPPRQPVPRPPDLPAPVAPVSEPHRGGNTMATTITLDTPKSAKSAASAQPPQPQRLSPQAVVVDVARSPVPATPKQPTPVTPLGQRPASALSVSRADTSDIGVGSPLQPSPRAPSAARGVETATDADDIPREFPQFDPFIGLSLLEMQGSTYLNVTSLWVGGPAAAIGIVLGDAVTHIGGVPVTTLDEMRTALRKFVVGRSEEITYVPKDSSVAITAPLRVMTTNPAIRAFAPSLYFNTELGHRDVAPPRAFLPDSDAGSPGGISPRSLASSSSP